MKISTKAFFAAFYEVILTNFTNLYSKNTQKYVVVTISGLLLSSKQSEKIGSLAADRCGNPPKGGAFAVEISSNLGSFKVKSLLKLTKNYIIALKCLKYMFNMLFE